MKKYSKIHTNPKAAINHNNKIKKRGGLVASRKTKSGITLEYTFPKTKQKELF